MKKAIVAYNLRTNGLGNRIRVTLGAKKLAEATNRHLFVVWPTGEDFGPRFSDLWEGSLGTPIPRIAAKAMAPVFPFRTKDLRDIRDHDKALVWQIQTGSVLQLPDGVGDWEEDLRALRPVPAIAERITAMHRRFGGIPYVGVQIRTHATSHDITRQESPVTWFRSRLDEIRRIAPATPFYLSCDRADVQQEFLHRYPATMALGNKGGYNTVKGVQSAVVDIYLLAGAGHIVGPTYSSFVELAEKLANHRVPLENSRTPTPFRVEDLTTTIDPLRPQHRVAHG